MKPAAEAFDLADWPAAILAGGLATRLRPITETIPKALVEVAGQPFLAHQLRLLHGAGVRKVVLCVGYRGEMIEEEFGDGAAFGIELKYSFDGPNLLGTGGAIKKALPLLGERFLVLIRRFVFADRLRGAGPRFRAKRKTRPDDSIQE